MSLSKFFLSFLTLSTLALGVGACSSTSSVREPNATEEAKDKEKREEFRAYRPGNTR